MDSIKGFPKVNECDYCWELLFFYSLNESSNCQNMSNSSPPKSKSILVVSQVAIKCRSYPVKEHSIIGFRHDGAEADSFIVSSLA